MANITPEMARAELEKRGVKIPQQSPSTTEKPNLWENIKTYGLKDPVIGLAKAGHEVENLLNEIPGASKIFPHEEKMDYSSFLGRKPTEADEAIQGISQFAPSLVAPEANLGIISKGIKSIPKVGSLLSRVLGEGITQGAYSASQSPENRGESATIAGLSTAPFSVAAHAIGTANPLARTIGRTALSLGLGAGSAEAAHNLGASPTYSLLAGLGAGIGGNKFLNKNALIEKMTKGVKPEVAQERLDLAKKIGLDYLTPAEAGLSPMAARAQGEMSRGKGAPTMYEKSAQRVESERKAIGGVLNNIYNEEKMGPQISELYQKAGGTKVPDEVMGKFSDNAVVSRAIKNIERKPAFQESLKDVPKNSIAYWDLVKQSIGDLEQAAPNNEARIIGKTRKELVDHLDNLSPEYKSARGLYERKATREGLEQVFDRKEINGKNFYQALASQDKFDDLMHHLRSVPEAQDKLKAMRVIFKDLIGSPTIATAKGTEERGLFEHRNLGNLLETTMEHLFSGGKHSEEAINLITSPEWFEKMNSINKITDKKLKAAAMLTTLGRASAQAVPKSN